MTTEKKLNRSAGSSSFPKRETEVPTHSGVVHPKEAEKGSAGKVANRLAHKANKVEQEFERDNSLLFTK